MALGIKVFLAQTEALGVKVSCVRVCVGLYVRLGHYAQEHSTEVLESLKA